MTRPARWWHASTVYQIYPRSFQDSNGDGIGDLPGITARLDHLQALGVDVVWLSPVFASPNDDNGYDISDYRAIHPEFGTMADFQAMQAGMRQRGIRLLMDLVVNHTSDEHDWFRQARSARDSPFHDYYIWAEPAADGGPPNNWESIFSGSAWEWNEATGEYFLHLFSRRQPDLNWRNPRVRTEVQAVVQFWLDQGVDGFRMDAINLIAKPFTADGRLLDAPVVKPGFLQPAFDAVANGRDLRAYLQELRDTVLRQRELMSVAETAAVTSAMAVDWTDADSGCVDMLFHFEHVLLDAKPGATKWDLAPMDWAAYKACIQRWQTDLDQRGWNSLYLNNHDQPRAASRLGDGSPAAAKMLALLTHGQKGTPYVYQGEELGMTDYPFQAIDQCRDVETLNLYREWVIDQGRPLEEAMRAIRAKGRDNARTPMQWDVGPQAGFTTGQPWLAVNPNHRRINAQQQRDDPDSVFHFYRRLIALRKQLPVLVHGRLDLVLPEHPNLFAATRTLGDERLLVVCNLGPDRISVNWPDALRIGDAQLLLGNLPGRHPADLHRLLPWEAVLLHWPGRAATHQKAG